MAACACVVINFYRYTDQCYTLNNYHQNYAPQFQSMSHQDYWSQLDQGNIIISDKLRLW